MSEKEIPSCPGALLLLSLHFHLENKKLWAANFEKCGTNGAKSLKTKAMLTTSSKLGRPPRVLPPIISTR